MNLIDFIKAVLLRAHRNVDADLSGKTGLRVSRRYGAIDGLDTVMCGCFRPQCVKSIASELLSLLDSESDSALAKSAPYPLAFEAERARQIAWVAHCASAWMVMNGHPSIVEAPDPNAVFEAFEICYENENQKSSSEDQTQIHDG